MVRLKPIPILENSSISNLAGIGVAGRASGIVNIPTPMALGLKFMML
jgi:hypothetical protein